MIELIKAGGWMMYPIILASVIAVAIIIERFLALRRSKVIPQTAIDQAKQLAASGHADPQALEQLRDGSMIGKVLAAGLASSSLPRHIMKENVEEAGRHIAHYLERYLPALATIGAISPLMGLQGTVFGMIGSFQQISKAGVNDPSVVSSGIAEALITTAAGITVALLAVIFHRYFKARVDNYVVRMEEEAVKLIELVNQVNTRRSSSTPPTAIPSAAAQAHVPSANAAQSSANERAAAAIAAARQRMKGG